MAPDLTSTRNPRVREAAALLRRRDREDQRRYIVEGPRYVADLLARPTSGLVEVLVTAEHHDAFAPAAAEVGVALTVVTPEIVARITDSETPQGVVAIAAQRRADVPAVVGEGTLVVLDRVSDPGNAGAIVRTAVAAGARAVVFTAGSVDPWNPKAVRASAGTVATAELVVGVTIDDVADACARVGQRVIALDTSGTVDVRDPAVLEPPIALLLGSEAHGLDAAALDRADVVASIPLHGPVESLNLGAAAAVAIFAADHAARREDG